MLLVFGVFPDVHGPVPTLHLPVAVVTQLKERGRKRHPAEDDALQCDMLLRAKSGINF